MKEMPKKLKVDFNLNDNAKKVTIWVGIVIITVAFFNLISYFIKRPR